MVHIDKLSIVIPVYNEGRTIHQILDLLRELKLVNDIQKSFGNGGVLQLLNVFSGGGLSRIALFALGIMPYITASIILQLLVVVIPRLEALKKEGQSGQTKITQYTRYLTLALAILYASFAMPVCSEVVPPEVTLADGVRLACHLYPPGSDGVPVTVPPANAVGPTVPLVEAPGTTPPVRRATTARAPRAISLTAAPSSTPPSRARTRFL